jgi:hypothetical protein
LSLDTRDPVSNGFSQVAEQNDAQFGICTDVLVGARPIPEFLSMIYAIPKTGR